MPSSSFKKFSFNFILKKILFSLFIILLFNLCKSEDEFENKNQFILNDNVITSFKFKGPIKNILRSNETNFFVAGQNYIYLINDLFSKTDEYVKKVFYKNSINEYNINSFDDYSKPSIAIIDYLKTNQELDNDQCLPYEDKCQYPKKRINNENRILIGLDSLNIVVLICGSGYQGLCFTVANLQNLKKIKIKAVGYKHIDLIASQSSNFMFKTDLPQQQNEFTYFLAHEPEFKSYGLNINLMSHLVFKKNGTSYSFSYYIDNEHKTALNINSDFYKKKLFEIIYGFKYEKFAFTLKIDFINEIPVTRLGRVCLEDSSFFSYTELPLRCKTKENKIYSLATTAYFGNADTELEKKTEIKYKKNTLYVVFGYYNETIKGLDKNEGSAICAFTIEQIIDKYFNTIDSCYKGPSQSIKLMPQYDTLRKYDNNCQRIKPQENFICLGSNINRYVESLLYFEGILIHEFPNDYITSLIQAIQQVNNKKCSVFGLGTNKGEIFKLYRLNSGFFDSNKKIKFENSFINPNPIFNQDEKIIYFANSDTLIKYPIRSCAIYSNCHDCLNSTDILGCSWATIPKTNFGSCLNKEEFAMIKKSFQVEKLTLNKDQCAPIIKNFEPKLGPVEGNTLIKIFGLNLCKPSKSFSESSNYKVNVKIDGKNKCELVSCSNEGLICKTKKASKSLKGKIELCINDSNLDNVDTYYKIKGCSLTQEEFNFVETIIEKIEPNYGPIGGGTKLTFFGKNLNSGSNRQLKVNGADCIEINSNNTNLECLLKEIVIENEDIVQIENINKNGDIVLEIDENKYKGFDENLKFNFKPNPFVLNFSPKSILQNTNLNLSFDGKYFDSVFQTRIKTTYYTNEGKEEFQTDNCWLTNQSFNKTVLKCPSPSNLSHIKIKSAKTPLEAQIQLIANEELIMNHGKLKEKTFPFLIYPLPKFNIDLKKEKTVSLDSKKRGVIEFKGKDLSVEYPVKIVLKEVLKSPQQNNNSLKFTENKLVCNNEQAINHKIIKCAVDMSNYSIDNSWISEIFFDESTSMTLSKIKFEYSKEVLKSSVWNYLVFIFLILIAMGSIYATCLYKKQKLEFNKEKKFPHFSVTYNRSIPNVSNFDSPFIRQSSQNGMMSSKISKPQQYKIRLAEDNILIPQTCLKINKKIGTGYFGCVYQGNLKLPSQNELQVAVKTLKNATSENTDIIQSFLEEAFRMKDFKHENVLTLIGVCLQEDSLPMIVLPFMSNGDLLTYIRCESNFPTVKNLLYFAVDVAKGMSYLSSLKYVHRDLAARNCMMDENLRIKVADFGLTRDVYERNYYTSKRKGEIPIKWMAPECIEKYLTTVESDVWSYGILLWELMTRGNNPYPSLENYQVLDFLKAGGRMQRPETCPIQVYEIMLDCWQISPKQRPNFDSIINEIENIIEVKQQEINLKADLSVNYINYPISQYYSNNNASAETVQQESISNSVPVLNYYNYEKPIQNINTSDNSMSTFKTVNNSPPVNVEMPGKSITLSSLQNFYDNEFSLFEKKNFKNSNNNEQVNSEISVNSNKDNNKDSKVKEDSSIPLFNFKLNRQNAVDYNEADTKTYEYLVPTPHIFIDTNKKSQD